MKIYFPLLCITVAFLLLKLSVFGIRLSDSNIYFYTGYSLLQGKLLYKDIFFTNLPLLPYISALYYVILGGSLKLFFLTPAIEVLLTTTIIYLIAYKQTRNIILATCSAIIYPFSFIVLSTSDHQSGVFLASFFVVLSYYFHTTKNYLLSGIIIALSLLTKAYFLPIILAFVLFHLYTREGKWWHFFLGLFGTGIILMLPTLIYAYKEFWQNVLQYSLTRSQGVEKSRLLWFFISHDLMLFGLLIWSMCRFKKNILFGLASLLGILFFFMYKDVYYLYLNFLVPFLCLSLPSLLQWTNSKFKFQKMLLPTFILVLLVINIGIYLTSYANLQKLANIQEIITIIKKEDPPYIYGTNDIAPALSYLSGVPLLENIIDTNPNIYRKGYLNAAKLTKRAVATHSLFIGHSIYYPESNMRQDITDEIFDEKELASSCTILGMFPVKTESIQNQVTLFRCPL